MNKVDWWTETGKPKVLGGKYVQCDSAHYKSQTDWSGIKPWPLQWEAGD